MSESPQEMQRKLVLLERLSSKATEISNLHEASGHLAGPDSLDFRRSSVSEDPC